MRGLLIVGLVAMLPDSVRAQVTAPPRGTQGPSFPACASVPPAPAPVWRLATIVDQDLVARSQGGLLIVVRNLEGGTPQFPQAVWLSSRPSPDGGARGDSTGTIRIDARPDTIDLRVYAVYREAWAAKPIVRLGFRDTVELRMRPQCDDRTIREKALAAINEEQASRAGTPRTREEFIEMMRNPYRGIRFISLEPDDRRRALVGRWAITFTAETDSRGSPFEVPVPPTNGSLVISDSGVVVDRMRLVRSEMHLDQEPNFASRMACWAPGVRPISLSQRADTVGIGFTPGVADCGFTARLVLRGDSASGTWSDWTYSGSTVQGRLIMVRRR
jgi:hypothetical protein